MKRFVYFVAIFLASYLWSCNENSTNPDSEYGIIEGIVVNEDLYPIKNVELYTIPGTEVILSNDSGKFTFKKVPEGKYSLYAKKNTYNTKSIEIGVLKGKTSNATIILNMDTALINDPPNKPILINPSNGSTKNSNVNLKWSCSDADDDELTYDLFLGTSPSNLELLSAKTKNTEYLINNPTLNTTYYWKVIVYDTEGLSNESETWSFKVEKMIDNSITLKLDFEKDFNDKSNYKQTVNNTNAVLAPDRFGNENSAAYFNGTANIQITTAHTMNFNQPFTVMLWTKISDVNYNNTYAGEMDLISRYRGAEPNTSSFSFLIKTDYLRGEVYRTSGGVNLVQTSSKLTNNEWSHVALVYNGSKLIIYKNGIELESNYVHEPDPSTLNLFIGMRAQGNRYFFGYMDDIYVYSKALTSSEILEKFKE